MSESKERATNRLARESSPYLLLHRHNPVDWYPWGEEAIESRTAVIVDRLVELYRFPNEVG